MNPDSNIKYHTEDPYPPIDAKEKNMVYANAMLDNIGGSNSEMSAVSLYFYNHIITKEQEEIAGAFHNISIVEMHHLEIFAALAYQLGENPRLWSHRECGRMYWSPSYNHYPVELKELLENACVNETAAIRKYEHQLTFIKDDSILNNLRRIIEDEKLHLRLLENLMEKYCK